MLDLARITEEYQARRKTKAAQEREAFTAAARRPVDDLVGRLEAAFEREEARL